MSDIDDLTEIIREVMWGNDHFPDHSSRSMHQRIARAILTKNYVIPKRVPDGDVPRG